MSGWSSSLYNYNYQLAHQIILFVPIQTQCFRNFLHKLKCLVLVSVPLQIYHFYFEYMIQSDDLFEYNQKVHFFFFFFMQAIGYGSRSKWSFSFRGYEQHLISSNSHRYSSSYLAPYEEESIEASFENYRENMVVSHQCDDPPSSDSCSYISSNSGIEWKDPSCSYASLFSRILTFSLKSFGISNFSSCDNYCFGWTWGSLPCSDIK